MGVTIVVFFISAKTVYNISYLRIDFLDWILSPVGQVSWMTATAILIISLCMAVTALSVLYKKIAKISYDVQHKTDLPTGQVSQISGPVNVRVVKSFTRDLSKMLPPHVMVPMSDSRHDDLYEAFHRDRANRRSNEEASSMMPGTSETLSLQAGMSENPNDIPTTYIDEDEL